MSESMNTSGEPQESQREVKQEPPAEQPTSPNPTPGTNAPGTNAPGTGRNGHRRPVSSTGGTSQPRKPAGQRRVPMGAGGNRKDEMDFGHIMRTVLLWAAMLLGVVVLIVVFNSRNNPTEAEISTSDYQSLLDSGEITTGRVEQYGLSMYRFHGQLRS